MAEQARSSELVRFLVVTAVSLAAVAGVLALLPGSVDLSGFGRMQPQLDLEAFRGAPQLVQLHLATVMIALVLGPIQFIMPKGTRGHRSLGWVWMVSMLVTAVTSLFIREINDGGLSPIHIFSFWTLISVPLAIWFARRGMIAAHRSTMIGLYIGLVIAGVLSAAPGRLTWDIFFG